jgi:predicted  nucleic acid-binding Zn-ribbon protein
VEEQRNATQKILNRLQGEIESTKSQLDELGGRVSRDLIDLVDGQQELEDDLLSRIIEMRDHNVDLAGQLEAAIREIQSTRQRIVLGMMWISLALLISVAVFAGAYLF